MSLNILLVDSDDMMCGLVSSVLKTAGHVITEAADCEEGMRFAFSQHPDMILSALRFPGRNGLELLQELKSNLVTSAAPFIFLTGDTHPDNSKNALRLGVSAFLTKPIRMDELLEVVCRYSPPGTGSAPPKGMRSTKLRSTR